MDDTKAFNRIEIYKEDNPNIERLFDYYKEDRQAARVYFHSRGSDYFSRTEIVAFEDIGTSYFRIIEDCTDYRITENNRIVKSIRKGFGISYGKNGVYLLKKGKLVKPASSSDLSYFSKSELVRKFFYSKLNNLEFLDEFKGENKSYNTVMHHKLFTPNKFLRHIYGFQDPKVNKLFHKVYFSWSSKGIGQLIHPKKIKQCFKYFTNVTALLNSKYPISKYFVADNILSSEEEIMISDFLKMSYTLGVPFNCKWSIKRIEIEHNKLIDLQNKLLIGTANYDLDISPSFMLLNALITEHKFDQDLILIKTGGDLISLGFRQSHCVASYSSKIENGESCVFEYLGRYSVEIGFKMENSKPLFHIKQAKGYRNNHLDSISNCKLHDIFNKIHQILNLNETADNEIEGYLKSLCDSYKLNLKSKTTYPAYPDHDDLPF